MSAVLQATFVARVWPEVAPARRWPLAKRDVAARMAGGRSQIVVTRRTQALPA